MGRPIALDFSPGGRWVVAIDAGVVDCWDCSPRCRPLYLGGERQLLLGAFAQFYSHELPFNIGNLPQGRKKGKRRKDRKSLSENQYGRMIQKLLSQNHLILPTHHRVTVGSL
ncbi:MAG: hypothetical protein GY820_28805 [Gammaproteobacteria bacterium]|nr:hypothetical protein [Gammaproteobacteria bacterium]